MHGEDSRGTIGFFNWYYWCINVGTLAALGGVAYLQQAEPKSGFFYGYLIGMTGLVFGAIVFLTGKFLGHNKWKCFAAIILLNL